MFLKQKTTKITHKTAQLVKPTSSFPNTSESPYIYINKHIINFVNFLEIKKPFFFVRKIVYKIVQCNAKVCCPTFCTYAKNTFTSFSKRTQRAVDNMSVKSATSLIRDRF